MKKPTKKPAQASFSSGPCPKRPGWKLDALSDALTGRSHRSAPGKAKLRGAIDQTRELLGVPNDYRIAIVAGSDTGAVEIALWNLLGARGVEVLGWESFGRDWVKDVVDVLAITDARAVVADYGEIPDLGAVDFARDVVFVWNGTTSGVKVPDGNWIPDGRTGLTICDATSAVFAMPLPWQKLDVVTFSWQKVLGGEGAHGMLILSPRAVQRLQSYTAPRPLPKLFRLTKSGQLDESIFNGATINTPSMLCVEDYLDALSWVSAMGGVDATINKSMRNLDALSAWVERTPWIAFLARDRACRSNTSVCFKFTAAEVLRQSEQQQRVFATGIVDRLAAEGVAFDINAYRSAPPGLRIWAGATVELTDIQALLPWIEWAHEAALTEIAK